MFSMNSVDEGCIIAVSENHTLSILSPYSLHTLSIFNSAVLSLGQFKQRRLNFDSGKPSRVVT